MKRKIVWLGVSWLIVAALVLASCGPGVPEGEEEEEEEEEIVFLSIGETYQTLEMAVTVSEAIVTDSYEYYDQASDSMLAKEASPGMSFLISTAEIENVGSTPKHREGFYLFSASDSEGNTYFTESYFGENRLPEVYTLSAGAKVEGKILFNIQEGTSGLKIAYVGLKYPSKKLAEWVIK